MKTLIPPPELIAKKDELKQSIDNGLKTIGDVQKNVKTWQEDLQSLEHTLAVVYGEKETEQIYKETIEEALATVKSAIRRRITIEEYQKMVLGFMTGKGMVRSAQIKEYIASIVGYPMTDDAISVAMDKLVKNPSLHITKVRRGLFQLDQSTPAPVGA